MDFFVSISIVRRKDDLCFLGGLRPPRFGGLACVFAGAVDPVLEFGEFVG